MVSLGGGQNRASYDETRSRRSLAGGRRCQSCQCKRCLFYAREADSVTVTERDPSENTDVDSESGIDRYLGLTLEHTLDMVEYDPRSQLCPATEREENRHLETRGDCIISLTSPIDEVPTMRGRTSRLE
jgi:hypothetical protein